MSCSIANNYDVTAIKCNLKKIDDNKTNTTCDNISNCILCQ